MNWSQLLSSMDTETFNELNLAVSKEQKVRIEFNATFFPDLNEHEKDLARSSKIEAIVAYRESHQCSLYEAKIKVEQYLNR